MAGASAINEVGYWRVFMMARRFASVVDVGVTACAVRLIGVRPGNDLVVTGVAVVTCNTGVVITGVVGRIMSERCQRRPGFGVVAANTIHRSDKVRCALAYSWIAIVAE